MAYTRQTLRLRIDVDQPRGVLDAEGKSPWFWRNNDVALQIAFFANNALIDTSGLASLTLKIKELDDITGTPLASVTATGFDDGLTEAEWDAGTGQHITVTLTKEQTSLALVGLESYFHVVMSALTTDDPAHEVTLGVATLLVIEDGRAATVAPPVPSDQYYTRTEGDARYAALSILAGHMADTANPHAVTKAQVELGNVDNIADDQKTVYAANQLATSRKINGTLFSGLADIDGFLPSTDNSIDLGKGTSPMKRLKDGWFSGNVTANTFTAGQVLFDAEDSTIFIGYDSVTSTYALCGAAGWNITGGVRVPVSAFPDTPGILFGTSGAMFLRCDGTDYAFGTTGRLAVGGSWVVTEASITKTMIGLGSVNNTSDAMKPVSGPQQTALDLKADKIATELLLRAEDDTVVKFKVVLIDGVYDFQQVETITGL